MSKSQSVGPEPGPTSREQGEQTGSWARRRGGGEGRALRVSHGPVEAVDGCDTWARKLRAEAGAPRMHKQASG